MGKFTKTKNPKYNSSSMPLFIHLPQEWRIWLFSLLTKSSLTWKLDSCSFQLWRRKHKRKAMDESQASPWFVTARGDIWLGAVLTNDCHQWIKIPYVKALSGNINEEFNDLCSLFLFCRLQIRINICNKHMQNWRASQVIIPHIAGSMLLKLPAAISHWPQFYSSNPVDAGDWQCPKIKAFIVMTQKDSMAVPRLASVS